MKFQLLLFAALLFFRVNSAAQECSNCNTIGRLDERIFKLDVGIPAGAVKHKEDSIDNIREIVKTQLIPELRFNEAALFKTRLEMITHVETITWLEFVVADSIKDLEDVILSSGKYPGESPAIWKERLLQINQRMDELFEKEFTLYRFTEFSSKPLRGLYAEHGNDFLHFQTNHNEDRDMTGAFRFEAITDLFKMRVVGSDKAWSLNSRSWYSYQTIFLAGEGYTPYLRDTSIFNSPTAVDSSDRPYASFIYGGYSKHRIFRNGMFKMNSRIKIGTIGSARPGGLQSLIHRDLNIGAYTPNGWNAQIAFGGRVAIQYDLSHEYMLLTKGWLISDGIRNRFQNKMQAFPRWINVSVFDEIRYGHDMTSLGGGINIGTCDFKRSGDYLLPFASGRNRNKKYVAVFNYRFTFRNVIHNSMLQGYGITKQTLDEDPTSPQDVYILTEGQVEDLVYIHELQFSIKLRHVGLFYRATFMSPEYDLPVNSKTYQYGEDGATANHNTSPWNHIGTVGLFFVVK